MDGAALELTTTGVSSDGRALARQPSGRTVFVAGALPGERVMVAIDDERRSWAAGRVTRVIESSPDRTEPPCPRLLEGCGGCQWQHVSPDGQSRMRAAIALDALRRLGGISDPPLRPTVRLGAWDYRTSIRAGVLDGRAALRRRRSHDLTPVAGCLIAHPLLSELLDGRRYDGAREVLLRCGARTGERLVATTPAGSAADVPGDVRRDHFHEEAAGRRWRVSARSFFQARPDGADMLAELVSEAASGLGRPGRAADLYSGVGLFAGTLASSGWAVVAVEGSATSVADASVNLSDRDVEVVRADVRRWTARTVDLVVADPSRDGLGRSGVDVVAATGAGRVVLVSCDAAAMARDVALLGGAGYDLTSVTPVDLFPQTFRVEVVAVLDLR